MDSAVHAYKRQTTFTKILNESTGMYSIGNVGCIGDVIAYMTTVSKWFNLRCLGCTWVVQLIELICVLFTNEINQ